METPNTQAGRLTEEIMAIFWRIHSKTAEPMPRLTTAQYNRVYSHVLDTLTTGFEALQRENAEFRKTLEAVEANGCGCYAVDKPDWHSGRCVMPKVSAALAAAQPAPQEGK
jgi:hypothetical protein